jgi:hypothetical protein
MTESSAGLLKGVDQIPSKCKNRVLNLRLKICILFSGNILSFFLKNRLIQQAPRLFAYEKAEHAIPAPFREVSFLAFLTNSATCAGDI